MRIGELAKVVGMNTTAIRYYESKRLLPPASRTPANYRTYSGQDVQRLRLIRKAKCAGLPLRDVGLVIRSVDRARLGTRPEGTSFDEVLSHLDALSWELETLRAELARLLKEAATTDDCRPSGGRICAIIEGAQVSLSKDALSRLARVLQRRALQRAT